MPTPDQPTAIPDDPRFGGIARLFGNAGLARLAAARVAVVGVGGVGSWAAEALARSGIGHLTLIDADEVCVTNTNRHLTALTSTVGRPKVDVLAARLGDLSPTCRITAKQQFFTNASCDSLLAPGFDWVLDAIDKLPAKALLVDTCVKRGIRVVTVGGAGGKRLGCQIRIDDLLRSGGDDLLRQLRKRLRRDHGWPQGGARDSGVVAVFSTEPPVHPWSDGTCRADAEPGSERTLDCATGYGTASFVTGAFGFAAAAEIVRQIAMQ
jgi:tRNA A37 threonylcarbamoyladenosine dehydratase